MIVSPNTVDKMFDNFKHLVNQGYLNIQVGYELGVCWKNGQITQYLAALEKIINFVANWNAEGQNENRKIELFNFGVYEPVFASSEQHINGKGDKHHRRAECGWVRQNIP